MEKPILLVTIDWQLVSHFFFFFPHFHVISDLSLLLLLAGFLLGYPACWSARPRLCVLAASPDGRGKKTFVPASSGLSSLEEQRTIG